MIDEFLGQGIGRGPCTRNGIRLHAAAVMWRHSMVFQIVMVRMNAANIALGLLGD